MVYAYELSLYSDDQASGVSVIWTLASHMMAFTLNIRRKALLVLRYHLRVWTGSGLYKHRLSIIQTHILCEPMLQSNNAFRFCEYDYTV